MWWESLYSCSRVGALYCSQILAFGVNVLLLGLVGTRMDHPILGRQGLWQMIFLNHNKTWIQWIGCAESKRNTLQIVLSQWWRLTLVLERFLSAKVRICYSSSGQTTSCGLIEIILNLNHLEQSMWEDMSKIVFWPAERLSMTIRRILYSSVSANVNSLPFNLWTAWSLPDLVSIWILYQRDLQNLRTGKEFISDNTGVFARYNCCIML